MASGDQPSISAGPHSVWVSYQLPVDSRAGIRGERQRPGPVRELLHTPERPHSDGRGNYGDTAVGPDGQVMVTYQDQTTGQGGSRIYTALDPDGLGPAGFTDPRLLARSRVGGFDSSDDNGATWSAAVRLNDHGTNSQVNPAIAVDQASGDIAFSGYDARNDLGSGGPGGTDGVPNDDAQVWAAYSSWPTAQLGAPRRSPGSLVTASASAATPDRPRAPAREE